MNKLLTCSDCKRKTDHTIEGPLKLCSVCGIRTSYKHKFRKRWNYAKSHPDIVGDSPYNQETSPAVMDKFDEIYSKLHLLSPREQSIVVLLWEGKTQREVAAELQTSQPNVAQTLRRVRKKLQE